MRVNRVPSFSPLPPTSRRGHRVNWCEHCGARYTGDNCPHCRPPRPAPRPTGDDQDEPAPASALAVGLWIAALMLAGLCWLVAWVLTK